MDYSTRDGRNLDTNEPLGVPETIVLEAHTPFPPRAVEHERVRTGRSPRPQPARRHAASHGSLLRVLFLFVFVFLPLVLFGIPFLILLPFLYLYLYLFPFPFPFPFLVLVPLSFLAQFQLEFQLQVLFPFLFPFLLPFLCPCRIRL